MMPNADGTHYVILNTQNFKDARIRGDVGDRVDVTIEVHPTPRTVVLPDDWAAVLADYPAVEAAFWKLSMSKQAYLVKWISEPKSLEARANRMAKSLDLIMKKS